MLVRDSGSALGSVELRHIEVSGDLRTDDSLKADVILHRIVLEDTRPGRSKGITRYVPTQPSRLSVATDSYIYVQSGYTSAYNQKSQFVSVTCKRLWTMYRCDVNI